MTDDQRRDHDVRRVDPGRGARACTRSSAHHDPVRARPDTPGARGGDVHAPDLASGAGADGRCGCPCGRLGRRRRWAHRATAPTSRTLGRHLRRLPSSASPVASSSPIPTPSGILLSAGSRTTDDLHTDPAVQCPSGMDPGLRRADGVPHQSPHSWILSPDRWCGLFRRHHGVRVDRWPVNPTVGCRPWKAWGRARRSSRRG